MSIQSMLLMIALWLLVMISALGVIHVTYQTRVSFDALESLRREESQLQVAWGQYLLEESAWAGYGRVERLAQEKLSMQVPITQDMIMVSPE